MTSDTRCPSCKRSVSSDFVYCPYCQAELRQGAANVPEVTLAPGERQGRRDLGVVGWGLVILGLFGFVGAVMSLFGGRGGLGDLFPGIVGGALLLVLAGFVIAGVARGGGSGVASGLLTGCASVAALLGVGALLVLAMIGYAFMSCIADLNKLGH
jgi:hypothetical protein